MPTHAKLQKLPFDTGLLPQSAKAFLVGGSVRDLMLGLPSADYDIAVEGNPEKYAAKSAQSLSGRLVLMGKPGLEIYRVVTHAFTIDISPIKGSSIHEDLKQRDFTVNAMACSLSSAKQIDPLGGARDLKEKTIRMVSETAFEPDPIRLLRAFRLAAALDFTIDSDTLAAISRHAPLIGNAAGERIRAEIMALFATPKAYPMLCRMADAGLLFHLFPALQPLVGFKQNRFHERDVYRHTLSAFFHLEAMQVGVTNQDPGPIPELSGNLDWALLKWAILLHDIGKPATRTTGPDGVVHFYGHAEQGAQLATRIAHRLRFSTRAAKKLSFIIKNHVRPLHLFAAVADSTESSKAKTRFFIKCGDTTPEILLLAIADTRGKGACDESRTRPFIRFSENLLSEFFTRFIQIKKAPPLITGRDLIQELGISPSPLFKNLLEEVETARLSGAVNDRQSALEMAKELLIRLSA